jgi:ATP-dependent DNA helicase RecG
MSAMMTKRHLEQPIDRLRSVGPKKAALLNEVGVRTLQDLFSYFPRRYLDRSTIAPISSLKEGEETTIYGKVVRMGVKRGRRNRFLLLVSDGTATLTCVWFSRLSYWQKVFTVGEWLALSGKVNFFGGPQITHPEFDRLTAAGEENRIHTGKIIPLYPSGEGLRRTGLDSRGFRRLIHQLFKEYRAYIDETLPEALRQRHTLMGRVDALENLHFPRDFDTLNQARTRLAYEEFFYLEVMVAHRKQRQGQAGVAPVFDRVGDTVKQLLDRLPFDLTDAQKRVLHQIRADLKSQRPMSRLLQGDVGSGKTIVAVISMLIAVENGSQSALMAPTEILAEQHYLTLRTWLESVGVKVVLLVGGQSRTERDHILDTIRTGEADVVVGTHALIQESVDFFRLGLVIIDEQHRFGVLQRALLHQKGVNPHLLVMTATPIPRTLSMTLYGDLDTSVLDELPKGRKPIQTYWRPEGRRNRIYQFLKQNVDQGAQAYIVFPLVEGSEKSDLKAAVDSYDIMCKTFFKGYRLGLIHGRMKAEEKDQVMRAFKEGELSILVTTTVIEVGVDVPNATIMIIEHAERFGLTQLHQLRGRVGRGEKQSHCILVGYGDLTEEAQKRLDTMVSTNDGFKISEVDLQLRGPGDFFGTRQHGLPELKVADITRDFHLLQLARDDAFELIQRYPNLSHPELGIVKRQVRQIFSDQVEDLSWVA